MVLWCHVASPERTNPVSIWRVKPWASSRASLTPSGLRDSSSRARRASRPRRRLRGVFPIGGSGPSFPPPHLLITLGERCLRFLQCIGHPLIGRRDWPPRTCLRDLLYEPPPLRFPEDHLAVDATNDRVIDHGIVIVRPIARFPALNAGLGARFAEEQGHERNQGANDVPLGTFAALSIPSHSVVWSSPFLLVFFPRSYIIGSSRLSASEDFHMTSRFPGPWRIAEFPNGFAVNDATGRQLGFFYGRVDPNMAGHASFLMIDDARQIAVDFARLPELLNQTSGRSEIATSTEDDQSGKLE